MTGQIPDTVIWKKKKYDLLGYEGEENDVELFDPKIFGLSPQVMHTACYRGFYCTYKIVRNVLYLDILCVNDGHDTYPTINGIDVSPGRYDAFEYLHLNLPIQYSGLLRIGADFHSEKYIHMGFQKPSAYGIVWDLELSDGKIVGKKDISEMLQHGGG